MERYESILIVRRAIGNHDLTVTSESDRQPASIEPGDPLYRAVESLQRTYPDNMLPPIGRKAWRKLLRESRGLRPSVYDAADEFVEWLDKECDSLEESEGPGEIEPDGPLGPPGHRIKWGQKTLTVSPQVWMIVNSIWKREHKSLADLEEDVWDGDDPTYGAVKSGMHRANEALRKLNVPWRLHIESGFVRKLPHPGEGHREGAEVEPNW